MSKKNNTPKLTNPNNIRFLVEKLIKGGWQWDSSMLGECRRLNVNPDEVDVAARRFVLILQAKRQELTS